MTDEEMAEEYENAQDYCGLLDVLFEEQYNQDYGGLSCYISPFIEQAYLAGLNAGKTKWHYVKDGDLPSEEGGWVCNQDGLPCFFDWGTEQWLDCEGTQIRTTEWCHMPHKE